MSLIDKLFGKTKTLSELSRHELRREEILLTKRRDKLFGKIEQIAKDKQGIFAKGRSLKAPELRKALAQQFELKTQEQLLAARELNLRSKELLTVTRLRMVKENQGEKAGALGRLNLTEKDVARITGLIENDSVSQDMYTERLDLLLEAGAESDREAMEQMNVGESGRDLMQIWDELDRGEVQEDEAFRQADLAARRRVGGTSTADQAS